MKRRELLAGLMVAATGVWAGSGAWALSYTEDIVGQLTRLGFSDIQVAATWLGRIKIHASRSDGFREIVLNPRTGEVLRDIWVSNSDSSVSRVLLDDVDDVGEADDNSGSGSDDSGSDSDNSGSGSDNSGSGSDNSGSGSDNSGSDNSGSGNSGSGSSGSGSGKK